MINGMNYFYYVTNGYLYFDSLSTSDTLTQIASYTVPSALQTPYAYANVFSITSSGQLSNFQVLTGTGYYTYSVSGSSLALVPGNSFIWKNNGQNITIYPSGLSGAVTPVIYYLPPSIQTNLYYLQINVSAQVVKYNKYVNVGYNLNPTLTDYVPPVIITNTGSNTWEIIGFVIPSVTQVNVNTGQSSLGNTLSTSTGITPSPPSGNSPPSTVTAYYINQTLQVMLPLIIILIPAIILMLYLGTRGFIGGLSLGVLVAVIGQMIPAWTLVVVGLIMIFLLLWHNNESGIIKGD